MTTKETLAISLATTIFTQIVITITLYIRSVIESRRIRKLIVADLKKQKRSLLRLKSNHLALYLKFRKKDLSEYHSEAFHDLHSEVHDSIAKTDLYKEFKGEITDLIDIYMAIRFLKADIPQDIYKKYTELWKQHKLSPNHSQSKGDYCETHMQYIVRSQKQIKLHVTTISWLIKRIDKITG